MQEMTLMPHQDAFIFDHDTPLLAIGGSVGPGKTVATVIKCRLKLERQMQQGIANPYGLFIRKHLNDLMDSVKNVWFEVFPEDRRYWNENKKELRFPNGAQMNFRHGTGREVLTGPSYSFIAIEQAEELDEDIFTHAFTRVRGDIPEKQIFINFNINGHDWIYRWFKVNDMKGVAGVETVYKDNGEFKEGFNPKIKLIECKTKDNPYLDEFYWDNLRLLPEHKFKRYVEADWEAGSNLVYPEFTRRHHVIDPFPIPSTWKAVLGADWGRTAPCCALDCRIDTEGNLFIVNEYYSPGLISEHAKAIKQLMLGDRFVPKAEYEYMLLDPAAFASTNQRGNMEWSNADEFRTHDLYFQRADNAKNSEHSGINRVGEYLRFDPEHISPVTGEKGAPRVFIFDRCEALIGEISEYKNETWKDESPKERPKKGMGVRDHAVDTLRYIINSRPPVPEISQEVRTDTVEYLFNEYKKKRNKFAGDNFVISEVFGDG